MSVRLRDFFSEEKWHSLQKCRLCRFFLHFRDIEDADVVPKDADRLLFRLCAGNLFGLKNLYPLNE